MASAGVAAHLGHERRDVTDKAYLVLGFLTSDRYRHRNRLAGNRTLDDAAAVGQGPDEAVGRNLDELGRFLELGKARDIDLVARLEMAGQQQLGIGEWVFEGDRRRLGLQAHDLR